MYELQSLIKNLIRMGYVLHAPGLNGGVVTVGDYRTAAGDRRGNWVVIVNNAVETWRVWPQDAAGDFVRLVGEDAARRASDIVNQA